MSGTDTLFVRLETHIEALQQKIKTMRETQTAIPHAEFTRDLSMGVELHQKYLDVLDEIREQADEESSGETGEFQKFSKKFDLWFSNLEEFQQEQYTRKGEIS